VTASLSGLTQTELESIAGAMADAGEAVTGPLSATPITGGRSNLTFRLDDGSHRWVLRMPPRHGRTPSAHDVGREYFVARSLAGTAVPVARAVLYSTDDSLLGSPFAVLGFCEGASFQSRESLDQLSDSTVAAMSEQLVTVLAALHGVDHLAVGLGNFGRPNGYAERQIKRWGGQWDLVGDGALRPLAARVIDLLRANIPEQHSTGIVHGDYRIDNTLMSIDPAAPEMPVITAVVDWELSTIGDPVADVATMCAYRNPAFDKVIGTATAWASSRLPSAEALAAAYEAAGGRTLTHWDIHLGLAHFKIAVIAAGIAHRYRVGEGADRDYATAVEAVEPFLTAALGHLTI
jgi:aminoglycoside phosphotransferase (APT) family kinase protein